MAKHDTPDKHEGLERATLFSSVKALESCNEPFDRAYFGNEFCQRRLPSASELQKATRRVIDDGRGFTLVTPYVTNAGMDLVKARVAELLDMGVPFELVVNDWGVLGWMRREHVGVPLLLGRLLSKQKRGPRILSVGSKLPGYARDHVRRSGVDTPRMVEFLRSRGVERVEFDNLLQGIARNGGLQASLYYPYGYITTTRLCLLMEGDQPGKNLRSIGRCHRECLNYDVTLRHEDMPVPLHLKGNTQFFRNDTLPKDLAALNITRLVQMPELP